MNSPSFDIKDLITESSGGTFEFGVNLFCYKQLDSPDLCITLYDTGGYQQEQNYVLERPTIQALIRGNQNNYQEAYDLAYALKEKLKTTYNQTVNGTRYLQIVDQSDVFFTGWDSKNRPQFTINFRIMRTTT